MASSRRGIDIPTGDPVREYTPEEEQHLTANLHALLAQVHAGALSSRPLDPGLLADLHAAIFNGVRSHAGRIRTPHFGAERLVFGPHRSADRRDVPRKLDETFRRFDRSLRSLEANPEDSKYELSALQSALWLQQRSSASILSNTAMGGPAARS